MIISGVLLWGDLFKSGFCCLMSFITLQAVMSSAVKKNLNSERSIFLHGEEGAIRNFESSRLPETAPGSSLGRVEGCQMFHSVQFSHGAGQHQ